MGLPAGTEDVIFFGERSVGTKSWALKLARVVSVHILRLGTG